jgi:hypothetical protein
VAEPSETFFDVLELDRAVPDHEALLRLLLLAVGRQVS